MNSRSYLKVSGTVVAVEIDAKSKIDTPAIEAEMFRIYGANLRLGRWSRRGKRRRAEVVRAEKGSHSVLMRGPDWFGGAL